MIRIGTAAWSMPRDVSEQLPAAPSALHRYGHVFNAVEINSSFHRPHRSSTYARWAASVDKDFRFSVKLPKAITHEAKLLGSEALIDAFAEQTSHLGAKRGPVLAQTPPKLPFDSAAVAAIASRLRSAGVERLAWEARHASWFTADADAFLNDHQIARVAADPAPHLAAAAPGGWPGLAYRRLHGAPRMYYAGYDDEFQGKLVDTVRAEQAAESWIIFDNTASGEASRNASAVVGKLSLVARP